MAGGPRSFASLPCALHLFTVARMNCWCCFTPMDTGYQTPMELVASRSRTRLSPAPTPVSSRPPESGRKVTFSQLFKEKCISEVVRIGSLIIFHSSKLWNATFFILCSIDTAGEILKLITLGSERVEILLNRAIFPAAALLRCKPAQLRCVALSCRGVRLLHRAILLQRARQPCCIALCWKNCTVHVTGPWGITDWLRRLRIDVFARRSFLAHQRKRPTKILYNS